MHYTRSATAKKRQIIVFSVLSNQLSRIGVLHLQLHSQMLAVRLFPLPISVLSDIPYSPSLETLSAGYSSDQKSNIPEYLLLHISVSFHLDLLLEY